MNFLPLKKTVTSVYFYKNSCLICVTVSALGENMFYNMF